MKNLKVLSCLLISLLLSIQAYGQLPDHTVILFAEPSPAAVIARLNQSIRNLNKTKDVISAIYTSAKTNRMNLLVFVKIDPKNYQYVQYNAPAGKQTDIKEVDLESKGGIAHTIYNPNEFQALLKDTLVLLDTLKLQLAFHSKIFPREQYYLLWLTPLGRVALQEKVGVINGTQARLFVPVKRYQANYRRYELHNSVTPERVLAEGVIYQLSEQQLRELKMTSAIFMGHDPNLDRKSMTLMLTNYLKARFGQVDPDQLSTWLLQHYPKLP